MRLKVWNPEKGQWKGRETWFLQQNLKVSQILGFCLGQNRSYGAKISEPILKEIINFIS